MTPNLFKETTLILEIRKKISYIYEIFITNEIYSHYIHLLLNTEFSLQVLLFHNLPNKMLVLTSHNKVLKQLRKNDGHKNFSLFALVYYTY